MQPAVIECIVADEPVVAFAPDDTCLRAYPEFLRYFRDLQVIEQLSLIIAANFIYGWMPTMLRFKTQAFNAAVAVLNQVKNGEAITDQHSSCLVGVINKSLVGASKLLHTSIQRAIQSGIVGSTSICMAASRSIGCIGCRTTTPIWRRA